MIVTHGHARQARFRAADVEIMDVCHNMSVFDFRTIMFLFIRCCYKLQSTRESRRSAWNQKMYTESQRARCCV